MENDYYEVMGLADTANGDEIEKAYRRLARRWHPDVNKVPEAEAKFKEISEAHEVLSDPVKKRKFDLSKGFAHSEFDVFDKVSDWEEWK